MFNYETTYNKIADFIRNSPILFNIFKVVYKYIPYGTMLMYPIVILWCAFGQSDITLWQTARVILVPLTGFVFVSLMRKFINLPRPYTKFNITPLITKNKVGESFPSRHTFSIGIIASACLYINVPLGVVMWLFTVVLATSRVIAGVHFVRDVVGAMVLALVWGMLGFYII